jgi:hypothetical protein
MPDQGADADRARHLGDGGQRRADRELVAEVVGHQEDVIPQGFGAPGLLAPFIAGARAGDLDTETKGTTG